MSNIMAVCRKLTFSLHNSKKHYLVKEDVSCRNAGSNESRDEVLFGYKYRLIKFLDSLRHFDEPRSSLPIFETSRDCAPVDCIAEKEKLRLKRGIGSVAEPNSSEGDDSFLYHYLKVMKAGEIGFLTHYIQLFTACFKSSVYPSSFPFPVVSYFRAYLEYLHRPCEATWGDVVASSQAVTAAVLTQRKRSARPEQASGDVPKDVRNFHVDIKSLRLPRTDRSPVKENLLPLDKSNFLGAHTSALIAPQDITLRKSTTQTSTINRSTQNAPKEGRIQPDLRSAGPSDSKQCRNMSRTLQPKASHPLGEKVPPLLTAPEASASTSFGDNVYDDANRMSENRTGYQPFETFSSAPFVRRGPLERGLRADTDLDQDVCITSTGSFPTPVRQLSNDISPLNVNLHLILSSDDVRKKECVNDGEDTAGRPRMRERAPHWSLPVKALKGNWGRTPCLSRRGKTLLAKQESNINTREPQRIEYTQGTSILNRFSNSEEAPLSRSLTALLSDSKSAESPQPTQTQILQRMATIVDTKNEACGFDSYQGSNTDIGQLPDGRRVHVRLSEDDLNRYISCLPKAKGLKFAMKSKQWRALKSHREDCSVELKSFSVQRHGLLGARDEAVTHLNALCANEKFDISSWLKDIQKCDYPCINPLVPNFEDRIFPYCTGSNGEGGSSINDSSSINSSLSNLLSETSKARNPVLLSLMLDIYRKQHTVGRVPLGYDEELEGVVFDEVNLRNQETERESVDNNYGVESSGVIIWENNSASDPYNCEPVLHNYENIGFSTSGMAAEGTESRFDSLRSLLSESFRKKVTLHGDGRNDAM